MNIKNIILSALAAGLFSISSPATGYSEPPTIGVSLPLSGDAASYGSDYRKIFTFANEVLTKNRYNLIFEDDRCSGKDAVAVAQKLITLDKVRYMLGANCDTAFSAAAPVYERAGVTLISMSSITVPGTHLFHTGLESRLWALPLYQYVSQRHKKIGIINEQTDFASNFAENFSKLDEGQALQIARETFISNEDNLKPQLLRLKQSNPEALVMATQTESSLYRIVKQLHEMGWELPRYTTFFPGDKSFLAMAGPLADGIIYSDFPDVMSVLNEDGKRLYGQFVATYGEPSSGAGLFLISFEAFRALDEAIRSGQPAEEYLRKTTFHGMLGDWKFQPDGFWSGYRHVMKKIENGKAVTLSH